jgi:ApbE superfamily uncharacterized protein (UPF0280 family)
MREPPVIRMLPDGRRLHLHDGPIDLIVEAFGQPNEVRSSYTAAERRFITVLDELCAELSLLRNVAGRDRTTLQGIIARRMANAVAPFTTRCFITPMAAVAGAVAEEILNALTTSANLNRAYVNNGGDIAVHLARGEHFTIGMVESPDHASLFGSVKLDSSQPSRGIATSGWRGRSFSLGIADAVTILAKTAAMADAAATIVANAVDLPGHPGILRTPAREIAPDSDLGDLLVTRAVSNLPTHEIDAALQNGLRTANDLRSCGLIEAAALCLQGHTRVVSSPEISADMAIARKPIPTRIAAHA